MKLWQVSGYLALSGWSYSLSATFFQVFILEKNSYKISTILGLKITQNMFSDLTGPTDQNTKSQAFQHL